MKNNTISTYGIIEYEDESTTPSLISSNIPVATVKSIVAKVSLSPFFVATHKNSSILSDTLVWLRYVTTRTVIFFYKDYFMYGYSKDSNANLKLLNIVSLTQP